MPRKTKVKLLQAPSGTHDILPQDQIYWRKIEKVVEDICEFYRFGRIDTPILEYGDLFARTVGGATEIVEKQMYTLTTKGGDYLALRPEGTAPIARAYIEHGMKNLPHPVKFYYIGPMFRYESPQKGRYRQFHQFGLEVLGEADSVVDVQIIQICTEIYRELGLGGMGLEINSIGCAGCRPIYKKLLSSFYRARAKQVCADCRRRLKTNVLRLLDCKEEKCTITRHSAPQTIDHLCEECHNHFKKVLEFLDELEIAYILNSHLVRGLDYYTRTVFEFLPPEGYLDVGGGATQGEYESLRQVALGAGGRYDNLLKTLGGKDTPAVGAAAGIERIVNEMKGRAILLPEEKQPNVFLVQLGDLAKKKSLRVIESLRKARILVAESIGRDSIKAQLKAADRLGVKLALIIGQKEALEEEIIVREMGTGRQETVSLSDLVKTVREKLKAER